MSIDLDLVTRLQGRLARAMDRLGSDVQAEIVERLSVPGSVVPFVASRPGEPSTNWDDELTSGITHGVQVSRGSVTLTVRSAGVSKYQHPGKVIAADAEFGSFWDGWAYDSRGGRWVKAARPHMVAPRPHMKPSLEDLKRSGLSHIAREARV